MRMYPAYKLRDVLEEYAVTFYALLDEAYRQRYADYVMLARISDLPSIDQTHREEFYKNLEWASTHPSDIINKDGQGSSPAELKRILGGK